MTIEIPDIAVDSHIWDSQFHPQENVIATSMITGEILLYAYDASTNPGQVQPIGNVSAHSESCRVIRFLPHGDGLITGSSDGTCTLLNRQLEKSWTSIANLGGEDDDEICGISSLCILSPYTFLAGDDDGIVNLWDTRIKPTKKSGPVLDILEHDDYISAMLMHSDGHSLISTSGDGKLSHCDLRTGKLVAMSDPDEDEMLSCVLMNNEKKVVVGCQSGRVKIFSWGDFGDCNDSLVGHPESVQSIAKFDERFCLTGASDGIIRIVHVCPNRIIGVVGEHEAVDIRMGGGDGEDDDGQFPVEALSFSHDKRFVASSTHDQRIKFWDVSELMSRSSVMCVPEEDDEQRADGEGPNGSSTGKQVKKNMKKINTTDLAAQKFFADL